MIVGYARTSTTDQAAGLADQQTKLKAAGAERLYVEQASAADGKERPELDKLLGFLRRDDVLVVTRLDRLARSTRDLLDIAHRLEANGVGLKVLDMNGAEIDTRSPTGAFLFTILGAVAQLERGLMLDRQKAGIAAAKAAGKYVGRQPTAMRQANEVKRLHAEGVRPADIARRLKIGRTSVYRALGHVT
jgi:DNA invertase Pin-like site-specific DNA recombinase